MQMPMAPTTNHLPPNPHSSGAVYTEMTCALGMHSALTGQQCIMLHCLQDVELLDDLDDEPDNVIRTRHGRPSKKAGKREGAGHLPFSSCTMRMLEVRIWLDARR